MQEERICFWKHLKHLLCLTRIDLRSETLNSRNLKQFSVVCFAYMCMRQLLGGSLEVLSDVSDENDDFLDGFDLGDFIGSESVKFL